MEAQFRKASLQKRDMATIVAGAAGLCEEECDLDLLSALHNVCQLLTCRAHAYSMCTGGGHLYNWMEYVSKLVPYYSRRPAQGFRLLTSSEAEEVDREVIGEVFRMVYHDDASVDTALETVVLDDFFPTNWQRYQS